MNFDKLSTRYYGNAAAQYDAKRERTQKWEGEQKEIAAILATLPRGSTVIDVPVGTGRFFEDYARAGLRVTGIDISDDMLAQSRAKADAAGLAIELARGDIRALPAADDSVDTIVCVRFLNWVDRSGLEVALRELARVTKTHIVCTIRHYAPATDLARAVDLRRLARQAWTRASRRIRPRDLVFHEKRQIEDVFARCRVEPVRTHCVERRHDGTDYYVYQLRKQR